jgi:hypothetical protein
MRVAPILAALSLVACGSGSGGGAGPAGDSGIVDSSVFTDADAGGQDAALDSASGDADSSADSGMIGGYPAAHPPMPQVVDAGGPVMKSPKFVIITFAGDSLAAQIDDFASKVAASATYWSGTTAEYGVGPVSSVLDIAVTDTPASNLGDADVQAWLASKLSGPDAGTLDGGAPWPQPDGETLYMIYYPAGVTITQGGGASCSQFYGYHGDFALASKAVTYSVIARCTPFPGTSAIDSVAAIASHELVEAATDPLQENPAYSQPDPDHAAWATLAGGELGDMCAGFGNVFYKPADVPYLVQRTWSNKAAAASLDPCQPDGVTPNFNTAAVLNDTVTFSGLTGTTMTKGVKIPAGGTGTVELDLYSSTATSGPWTVQAFDGASYLSMGGSPAELAVSFPGGGSTATGKNGDKLHLTINVLTADPSGGELFMLVSTLGTGSSAPQTYWVGLVGN